MRCGPSSSLGRIAGESGGSFLLPRSRRIPPSRSGQTGRNAIGLSSSLVRSSYSGSLPSSSPEAAAPSI